MSAKKVVPKSTFEEEAQKLREQNAGRRLDRIRNKSVVSLDPMVRKFCMKVAEGMTPSDAAVFCCFEDPGKAAQNLMRRPAVKKALNAMIERTMKVSEVTRDEVIEGFRDAINIARQQSEAMGMIAGWREIGKMLGMYETKVKIEVSGGARQIEQQLSGMSDADLLRMVHERSSLLEKINEQDIEDAEFEEVKDD